MPSKQPPDIVGQLIDLGQKVPVRVQPSQREQRLEAALLYILEETVSTNGSPWKLKIINRKCREALRPDATATDEGGE